MCVSVLCDSRVRVDSVPIRVIVTSAARASSYTRIHERHARQTRRRVASANRAATSSEQLLRAACVAAAAAATTARHVRHAAQRRRASAPLAAAMSRAKTGARLAWRRESVVTVCSHVWNLGARRCGGARWAVAVYFVSAGPCAFDRSGYL